MKRKPVRARKESKIKQSRARGVFSVRFSDHELNALRSTAASTGASLAGLVRQIVATAVDRPQASMFILGSQSGASAHAQLFGEVEHKNVWLTS
jgi:hypothetical protein